MRRTLSILAVAAVAAATLGAVSPAKAADSELCRLYLPEQTVVQIRPGQIDIYPNNVNADVNALVNAVTTYLNCQINETAGPVIACIGAYVANRPTVTVDPQTLHISINYSEFLGTTCTL